MSRSVYVASKVMATPSVIEEVARQRSWWSIVKSHVRRLSLEVLNVFINYDWLFYLVGIINKRVGLIRSVFLVYPASEEYALAYVYSYRLPRVKWTPWPCGLLWQNGKLTVMFCISARNGQFTDPQNKENVRRVAGRMEELRQMFCADSKTFAGILPGVLYGKRIIREAPEADLAAKVVVQAIEVIRNEESLSDETSIVVLGGRGFIGRRVVRLLDGLSVYSVDVAGDDKKGVWPHFPKDERIIVVNITLNNVVEDYIDVMRPGTVVINEVYPEPSLEIRRRLKHKKCSCYHVVGVSAFAWPSFPAAYRGGIPCCAAWPSKNIEVIVRKFE